MKLRERISFIPKNKKHARDDLMAGLSVAALALPQNMAYALIAGLDPIFGLYTSIVAMLAATFVGSSNYLIVGPTNIMALAVASSLAGIETGYLEAVLLFTFMVGVFQLLLTFLRLGELINFVSRSVVDGLTAGVSLLIIAGQLGNLTGIEYESGSNLLLEIVSFAAAFNGVNLHALIVGAVTMGIIIILKTFKPALPAYLLAISVSVLIVFIGGWQDYMPVVERFPGGLPGFTPVSITGFDLGFVRSYWSAALSVAVLGFIHVLGALKSMEAHTGEEQDFNRVFFGQGVINIICSFFSGFAVTGSFTKSFANLQAGARSRLSELVAALTMIVFITLFRPVGEYIPIAGLAGLVIMVAVKMVDFGEIRDCFINKFDALIFLATFLMTILAPRIDYAIYFGMIISFILILKETSQVKYSHIDYEEENGDFIEKKPEEDNGGENEEYTVINLAGNIVFSASDNFKEKLDVSFQEEQKFVLRMREVESIDLTSLKELEKFIDRVQEHGGVVIVCGLNEEIKKLFENYQLDAKIGDDNVFETHDSLLASTESAIEQANDTELPCDQNESGDEDDCCNS
ncbi:SulP family inorganic anion transporter [Halarsenatibacter silvermanii]|uniref:Sulfate permease, SulP family n=1 Tax=Halarsenatibacter silvermanii TaxID=321763 RepID=A0A1G9PI34_9FIRM|nr:SulP family inorganic anion transporter [Halarsenatibacter silvermanii]SDL97785.1 sulfate permease, SulP family [Halarsenatibacter silvermanii]